MPETDDYLTYRGRCQELAEELVQNKPSLRIAKGFYYCPLWKTEEQHWWAVDQEGKIHDPSKNQFPSKGLGTYREFDGWIPCEQCGKDVHIDDPEKSVDGHHIFCSRNCHARCVGF